MAPLSQVGEGAGAGRCCSPVDFDYVARLERKRLDGGIIRRRSAAEGSENVNAHALGIESGIGVRVHVGEPALEVENCRGGREGEREGGAAGKLDCRWDCFRD